MGKAVIATRVGGIPDVVLDGDTGILVPKCDPSALANAMRSLIANPQLADALGAAGKRYAATFTISQAVSRFDKLLEDLVETRRMRDHILTPRVPVPAPTISTRAAFNEPR
jgi:glycosyltransferase involved in cell wall biosynthesis